MAASQLPCTAVADVRHVDGSPGKQGGKTGKGKKPVKSGSTLWCQGDVGKETKDQGKSKGNVWAAMLVNPGEDLWSHAVERKSLDGTGRTVGTGVGDGDDGKGDNGVEDVWKNGDLGEGHGADHWRVLGVGAAGFLEGGVVGWNNKTEEKEGNNIEDGNTPEDLLCGLWKGLSRVVGLSSGETNQLSTSEGKCGSDEDGTPSLKAVLKSRVWGSPVFTSNVTVSATS